MGVVYLLHFKSRYGHAQHYMGYTDNLPERLERHRKGRGARLIKVITQAGISFEVARDWDGDRALERRLKKWNKHRQLCPLCKLAAANTKEALPDDHS